MKSLLTKSLAEQFEKRNKLHEKFVAEFGEDYDKPCTRFGLNRVEQAAVDKWTASLRAEIMAVQKTRFAGQGVDDIMNSQPYYGATGGGLTYCFTPTSLGDICVVKESITGKELNVNEATDWFFYG